jgi:hypothetical protein
VLQSSGAVRDSRLGSFRALAVWHGVAMRFLCEAADMV